MPWWAAAYVSVLTLSCLANHAVELPACLRKVWIHIANWVSTAFLGLLVFAYYETSIGSWLGKTAAWMMIFNILWGVYGLVLSRRAFREMRAATASQVDERAVRSKDAGRTGAQAKETDAPNSSEGSAEWFSLFLGAAMAAPAYLAGAIVAWNHW